MSKILACMFSAFYLSAVCSAQTPAAFTVSGLKVDVTPVSIGATSQGLLQVTNESRIPLVAMRFRWGCGSDKKTSIIDFLVTERRSVFIGYMNTYRWGPGTDILICPAGVDAAVFDDGHSEGDPKGISQIYNERKGTYNGITFVSPLLDAIVKPESEAEQPKALVAITYEQGGLQRDHTMSMYEKVGESYLLRVVADHLASEQDMGVPSDLTSFRGPGVEQIMKSQHLDHARASTFVLRRKLLEWQNELAGNLAPQTSTP